MALAATALLSPCVAAVPADGESATNELADHVGQLLKSRCVSCHGADEQEAGLRLDYREGALQGSDNGAVIVVGESRQSPIIERVTSQDPDQRMPPEGEPLTAAEVDQLRRWIDSGAQWPASDADADPYTSDHWAYQPIAVPALPRVAKHAWPRNGIDHFILQKLESADVAPTDEARRTTLIRRVYLDLTGLPPTPHAWRQWTYDSGEDWYERLVDTLLASPHFGERWGRIWLDLARYADSDGYEKDMPRQHAYQWRDWVIDAFNDDLPYDQFSEQQLAGDLLPGATEKTKLATGFHRNTLTNREGGVDKEEDRVKQVVDRTNTMASVWLGLTVKCAQCHSHKYDQISQREYFQLYAFFNSSDEANFKLPPTKLQQRDFEQQHAVHQRKLLATQQELDSATRRIREELPTIAAEWLQKYPTGVRPPPQEGLVAYLPFDGDAASALLNRIPQGMPARFEGSSEPSLTPGVAGSAIQLNGKDQRLDLGRTWQSDSEAAFTLSAWAFFQGGVGAIITQLDETNHFRGVDLTINDGMVEVHLVDTWPDNAIKVTTKEKVAGDEWHHVAVTYDGSRKAEGVAVYIDSKRQQLDVHHDKLTGTFAVDQPVRIGSRRNGTFFTGRLDEIRIYTRQLDESEIGAAASDQRLAEFLRVAIVPPDQRTPEQVDSMVRFVATTREEVRALQAQLVDLEKGTPKVQQGTGMGLVQREVPRQTFVHRRGNFLDKGSEVRAATPQLLHAMRVRGPQPDRLDLARWLLDPANTLTARVAVNRVWQQYFGRGLVASVEDFGSQGDAPTHPELLDWLATQWVRHRWSQKWLHRTIVCSAAYRQSSKHRRELAEDDPYNLSLAFRSRKRVEAEIVRDLALTASGLLDRRIKGPSVFPPLPKGIIELAFVDVINRGPWKTSSGGDRYRRGIYTFFQRTAPFPMLTLFDAPDSNTTCARRESSNTPLQALTMWNDPVLMECAQALADRLIREADTFDLENQTVASQSRRIRYAFVVCLGRLPTAAEEQVTLQLYADSLAQYRADSELTAELLAGIDPPRTVPAAEYAAWISVARTMLNLDEFITCE